MIKADFYYLENLRKIRDNGVYDINPRPKYKDGTPAYTKYITQVFEEYDISLGEFPITTLRDTAVKTGIKEILWIYQLQSSSLEDAKKLGISWWDEWDIGDNTIGKRYGATIKHWDLMNNLLRGIEKDPFGRRHIINMYQMSDLKETKGLFPCAYETLWSVRTLNDSYCLDLTLIQRSNDYLMAGYINKIQYVALQMMVASHFNFLPGKFVHFVQNLHVYDRHFDSMTEILNRTPLDVNPTLTLKENKNFYHFTVDDFKVDNIKDIKKLSNKLEIAI